MDVRVSPLGSPARSSAFLAPEAVRRVGLVLLETDLTSERDFARLTHGSGVAVYANRVAFSNPVSAESLSALEERLARAATALVPEAPFDVIHFGCTSASAVIGDAGVEAAVRAAKPGARVINPMVAADAALSALDVTRISILTPYVPDIARPVAERFAALGYAVDGVTCWAIEDDRDMARIKPDVLVREAIAATAREAEALFISCTAVPAAEVVALIESEIDRPVVTSNQAAAWMALRLCGVDHDVPGGGRLFSRPLAGDVQRGSA
ncbi:hypothetical protein [uncultured Rhodospira sp.]|uniref:aspartate racemase/maleate isomerase family protein n=1 Tax=uncultured Rhodospira sp. TaxID=1936189 RepID=UPI002626D5BA|nr:hypothetical protein [uncultured Rhodospira sp.]